MIGPRRLTSNGRNLEGTPGWVVAKAETSQHPSPRIEVQDQVSNPCSSSDHAKALKHPLTSVAEDSSCRLLGQLPDSATLAPDSLLLTSGTDSRSH